MNDTLLKFKEILDEEIQAYESLGELYNIKQSILVQGKSDALWDIDSKIVSQADNIKAINQKRAEVARYLGDEKFTLSDIIDRAKESNDIIVGSLEEQRKKLRILAKSLTLQENTQMTLIKHGLTMVGKTIDIIASAVMPEVQSGQYNKSGKNIEASSDLISSVVEEA